MDLAGYVVNAVLVEGRSVTDVCEAHDISRSWLYELIGRYRELGDDGLRPLSKRPGSSPTRVAPAVEEQIVALRKELTRQRRHLHRYVPQRDLRDRTRVARVRHRLQVA